MCLHVPESQSHIRSDVCVREGNREIINNRDMKLVFPQRPLIRLMVNVSPSYTHTLSVWDVINSRTNSGGDKHTCALSFPYSINDRSFTMIPSTHTTWRYISCLKRRQYLLFPPHIPPPVYLFIRPNKSKFPQLDTCSAAVWGCPGMTVMI